MIRAFRYPLKATRRQLAVLNEWRIRCCEIYNAALEQRRLAWKRNKASVSKFAQMKDLTALRASDQGWASMPVRVARSALVRLDRAFQAFFDRVKRGETPGYPRFRSASQYDSFAMGLVAVEHGRVRVPVLGWVRFRAYRPLGGVVRNVEILRTAQRWWVCVTCDVGPAPAKRVVVDATGIDLGLTHFATLADGTTIANPRHFQRGEERLAAHQRVLSRAQRGSNRRAAARHLVARAHERIANQRRDFHRKTAATLCAKYDLIAHEALNVKGLSRSRFSKSVNDAGWGQFLATLACKAESAGVHVIAVDPRFTTQACAACGAIQKLRLEDRVYACACGAVRDRDHNAALNIEARGRRALAFNSSKVQFGASPN